jgi:hypothetical protein
MFSTDHDRPKNRGGDIFCRMIVLENAQNDIVEFTTNYC